MASTITTISPDEIHEAPRPAPAIATAEVAECTCPEFCERDHDND